MSPIYENWTECDATQRNGLQPNEANSVAISVTVNKLEGKFKARSTSICRWTWTTRQSKEWNNLSRNMTAFLLFFFQGNDCQNKSAVCNAIYCKFFMGKKIPAIRGVQISGEPDLWPGHYRSFTKSVTSGPPPQCIWFILQLNIKLRKAEGKKNTIYWLNWLFAVPARFICSLQRLDWIYSLKHS